MQYSKNSALERVHQFYRLKLLLCLRLENFAFLLTLPDVTETRLLTLFIILFLRIYTIYSSFLQVMAVRTLQLFFIVTSLLLPDYVQSFIEGATPTCKEEGKEVFVKYISTDPCFKCHCKDKTVQCTKLKCPSNIGCHMILYDKPDNQCCHQCKGCVHKGKVYGSGQEWSDPQNPCKVYHCWAGVVTATEKKCFAPCKNPVKVPGQCCPKCTGCTLNGMTYKNGDIFTSKNDPCIQCECKDGNVVCSKRACPVLNCPSQYVYTPRGSCCSKCTGSRKIFDLGNTRCLFRNRVYKKGREIVLDKCTKCTCEGGSMLCESKTCAPLDCPEEEIIRDEKSCCPKCKAKKQCKYRGKNYKHGASWKNDHCTTCECDNGVARCHIEQCPNMVECPKNHRLQLFQGECCPKCVEEDAVCAVFGDPHYRTFDGRIFNFQGTCKYILAQDCDKKTFQVRVRNDARLTNSYAWTNMVMVHIKKIRITLHQNLIIKVNRKRVTLPYVQKGSFTIMKSGYSVIVRTEFGLKVVWDGDSYVEVAVPPTYKNKMCGLCGNYNGIESDDFLGRDGGLYLDSEEFGNSWRIGSKKACFKPEKKKRSDRPCNSNTKRLKAHKDCSILKSKPFAKCRSKVPVAPYYKT